MELSGARNRHFAKLILELETLPADAHVQGAGVCSSSDLIVGKIGVEAARLLDMRVEQAILQSPVALIGRHLTQEPVVPGLIEGSKSFLDTVDEVVHALVNERRGECGERRRCVLGSGLS